jgi:hypothetical protein
VLAGRPCKRTIAPISRERPNRAAHPWGFTKGPKTSGLNPDR